MSAIAPVASSDLTTRLKVVNILPTIAMALLVAAVVMAGAPGASPSLNVLIDRATRFGIGGLFALTAAVTMVSVALQPFELSMIRILEGYWPDWRVLEPLRETATWVQRRRWAALQHQRVTESSEWSHRVQAAEAELATWPERDAELLPMRLGNCLRAMERRAGSDYGLDAVVSFPRLYLAMPPSALAVLNESRNQLDASVRSTVVSAIGAAATFILLVQYGWWLLVPAGLVVLALGAYRASIVAAVNYGTLVEAAFSLYHLRILDESGVKRPANSAEVAALHERLERPLRGTAPVSYRKV